jgi:dihydropteroate synthase
MIDAGVDIIDIGGQSTRPGAKQISDNEEWKRIAPVLEIFRKRYPEVIISIDTFYASVAENALNAGASIINDISAGDSDPLMYSLIARTKAPYIIMHKQGSPKDMQNNPQYKDVVGEIIDYLTKKIVYLNQLGVHDLIVDPGFGFGKTLEHNYMLLKKLSLLKMIGYPILAGISRKSMITKVLDVKPGDALTGTIALNTIALLQGVSILRVHDVREAIEVRKIIKQYLLTD